jgi:casein kinase 1
MYETNLPNNKRTVEIRVGGRYRLGKKIGAGAFGEIYEGIDIFTGGPLAIKLEHISSKIPQLLFEAKLLKSLAGPGFPNMIWFGVSGEYNTMVMNLLGENLEDLFSLCSRSFSLKTVLMIGIEMIERIKHIHDNHYVHRDIKPENFIIEKNTNDHCIYLIDFGLAKRFRCEQTYIHITYKENKAMTGTARYASRNAHKGIEQSRRDDLESIAYVLIYFMKGSLPWQGLKSLKKEDKIKKIKEMKENISPQKLCEGLPKEFVMLLEYCQNLQYDQDPDYVYLIKILKDLYKSEKYENDFLYDWLILKNNSKVFKDSQISDLAEPVKPEKFQETEM